MQNPGGKGVNIRQRVALAGDKLLCVKELTLC